MKNKKTATDEAVNVKVEKSPSRENGARKNLLIDILVRLFTIVIAFFIWLYVANSTNVTTEKEFELVKIERLNTSSIEENNLVVESMSYDTVNLTLTGTRNDFRTLNASDVRAYIDLSDISEPGEYVREIKVNVPAGFAATLNSESVSVYVDKASTKTFEVNNTNINYESWSLGADCEFNTELSSVNINYVVVEGKTLDLEKVMGVRIKTNALGVLVGDVSSVGYAEAYDENGDAVNGEIKYKYYSGGELDEEGNIVGGDNVTGLIVTVKLIKTKEVPLTVKTEYGYISDIKVSPSTVIIKGAYTAVDSVREICVGTINEKHIITDKEEYKTVFEDVLPPEGISSVLLPGGEEVKDNKISAEVTLKLGKLYTLTVPKTAVTVVGGNSENYQIKNIALYVNVRLTGEDESVYNLLQQNLNNALGGLSVVADVKDVAMDGGRATVPVSLVFDSTFEGKLYAVTDESSPYTIVVYSNNNGE